MKAIEIHESHRTCYELKKIGGKVNIRNYKPQL